MKYILQYIVLGLVLLIFTACDSKIAQDDINLTSVPPIITINGESNMTIIQYQQYVEYGATAKDIKGRDLSVEISGDMDDLVDGVYHLEYTATDSKGKTASITRTVNVEKYDAEKDMEDFRNSFTEGEYSTEEDWKNTGYYKLRQNMTQEEKDVERRSARAFDLVSIAKDPDEEWWETDTNLSTVFRKTGEVFSVSVNKLDSEGTIIGPVDNEKLRLVVRIQRKDNTFKYITNNEINQYAKWVKKGILEVHVPDDLTSGRLLVGIRPNFDDVATTAITERWSYVIEAEVLEVKEGVIEPDSSNVLLPPKDADGISRKNLFAHTNFNDIEVVKMVDDLFDKGIPNRPMIIKGISVKKGDYVAYRYKHFLWSGMVVTEETRGDEQLIFLNFDILNVYHMVSRADGLVVKHGLYPEFAPFRISSEGADEYRSDRNESDPIRFKSLEKSKRKKLFKVTFEVRET